MSKHGMLDNPSVIAKAKEKLAILEDEELKVSVSF